MVKRYFEKSFSCHKKNYLLMFENHLDWIDVYKPWSNYIILDTEMWVKVSLCS